MRVCDCDSEIYSTWFPQSQGSCLDPYCVMKLLDFVCTCRYEFFFGGMSSSNICVTQAMQKDLWEQCGIRWEVVVCH